MVAELFELVCLTLSLLVGCSICHLPVVQDDWPQNVMVVLTLQCPWPAHQCATISIITLGSLCPCHTHKYISINIALGSLLRLTNNAGIRFLYPQLHYCTWKCTKEGLHSSHRTKEIWMAVSMIPGKWSSVVVFDVPSCAFCGCLWNLLLSSRRTASHSESRFSLSPSSMLWTKDGQDSSLWWWSLQD